MITRMKNGGSKRLLFLLSAILMAYMVCGCGGTRKDAMGKGRLDQKVEEAQKPMPSPAVCRIVLEASPAFYADSYVAKVQEGQQAVFILHPVVGWKITGCGYRGEWTITGSGKERQGAGLDSGSGAAFLDEEEDPFESMTLTLSDVAFSTSVVVQAEREWVSFVYYGVREETASDVRAGAEEAVRASSAAEEGTVRASSTVEEEMIRANITAEEKVTSSQEGKEPGVPVYRETIPITHLSLNTALAPEAFQRDGYVLYAWNTRPDGSGTEIGLGSRVNLERTRQTYGDMENGAGQEYALFAMAAREAPAGDFTTEPIGNGLAIAEYLGEEETLLAIPSHIGGLPVYAIASGAFKDCQAQTVILPPGLKRIDKGAFEGARLQTLYLFDDLQTVSAHAFDGCEGLRTLRIQAATKPVYSGNYFATFADKMDYLKSIRDKKKLVLFSGSSTRFGYDCAILKEDFPEYEPVNMGVFAYTNALPQLKLILSYMKEGDILLDSPEFDAPQSQFCVSRQMEWHHFAMMEANYDLLAELDLREYASVFAALDEYLQTRAGMEGKEYILSPSELDEDGNPVHTPSYNVYGDYILYRKNAESDQPVYGLPVDYTAQAFPKKTFLDPMNEVIALFQEKGIRFLITYAPRNEKALSASSSKETRAELDAYLRANLAAPVISDIEESMYLGYYLYGTDNHLSTEGVRIRTERIVEDLREYQTRSITGSGGKE